MVMSGRGSPEQRMGRGTMPRSGSFPGQNGKVMGGLGCLGGQLTHVATSQGTRGENGRGAWVAI